MFVVLLRFADNKSQAAAHMDGHNRWIKQGFDDGVFLLVGSLQPGLGGTVIAHNTSLSELQDRLSADPFVSEHVVTAEVLEIEPRKAADPLSFLVS